MSILTSAEFANIAGARNAGLARDDEFDAIELAVSSEIEAQTGIVISAPVDAPHWLKLLAVRLIIWNRVLSVPALSDDYVTIATKMLEQATIQMEWARSKIESGEMLADGTMVPKTETGSLTDTTNNLADF